MSEIVYGFDFADPTPAALALKASVQKALASIASVVEIQICELDPFEKVTKFILIRLGIIVTLLLR